MRWAMGLTGLVTVALLAGAGYRDRATDSPITRIGNPQAERATEELTAQAGLESRQVVRDSPVVGTQKTDEWALRDTVRGTILRITPEDQVTLLLAPDREMVLQLTPETRIRWGDQLLTRADLRVGQLVACVLTNLEGKHICHEMTIEML